MQKLKIPKWLGRQESSFAKRFVARVSRTHVPEVCACCQKSPGQMKRKGRIGIFMEDKFIKSSLMPFEFKICSTCDTKYFGRKG